MKISRTVILSVCILLSLVGIATTGNERQKARYYFMQGAQQASSNNMTSAYEYFKKAYQTDTTYLDAAFNYGSQRIFMQSDSLQTDKELKRSLGLMRKYIEANPTDLYAIDLYGYIATKLDNIQNVILVLERAYEKLPRETGLLLNLANSYMLDRQIKNAISTFERYENIEGKTPAISLKKITCYLSEGDTIAAIQESESLIKAKPRDPFSRLLKGNLYDLIGQPDSVLAAYKEAELLAPESGAVKMSLANYYQEIGDSVMLDNMMYEALLSEDFEVEDKLSILGEYLQKIIDNKGETSRGDYLFSVLSEQYPHYPEVLEMSARYNGAKGQFREAAEEIGYAIDLDLTNEKYWLMLFSYLLADNRYEDIVESYKKAIVHINPSEGLKNLYAGAVSQLEDTQMAKSLLYEMLEEINPTLINGDKDELEKIRRALNYDELMLVSSVYCMLGDIDYKEGNPAEAFKEYENSLRFYSENALTLNNYAYFLAEENMDLEKAKQMSRKSLDLSENNPTYLDTYAWILYKLREYKEALECQELAIELSEKEGEEINQEFYDHLNEIKKALQLEE